MSEEKQGVLPHKAKRTISGSAYGACFYTDNLLWREEQDEDICTVNLLHLCFNSTGIHYYLSHAGPRLKFCERSHREFNSSSMNLSLIRKIEHAYKNVKILQQDTKKVWNEYGLLK